MRKINKDKTNIFQSTPTSAKKLLTEYRKNRRIYSKTKIDFQGVDGLDVYNISAPFSMNGKTYIAGRVEKRDTVISKTCFFEKIDSGTYKLTDGMFFDNLQDPCITQYDGITYLGGTQIVPNEKGEIVLWRTVFYKGKDIYSFTEFAKVPDKMKDVRFVINNDKVLLFSRPQGKNIGVGQIGFIELEKVDDICPENINNAKLLDCFLKNEWGGANELQVLSNGLIGVLGHISYKDIIDDDNYILHYYAMVFAFDPKTKKRTRIKIIAERVDYVDGPAKKTFIEDVVFAGGLIRLDNGQAELYSGVGDTEGQFIVIDDPFVDYEKITLK